MIVKITFQNLENQTETYLFGDSYKNWNVQFEEFISSCSRANLKALVSVEVSKSDWIAWGGLKWCKEEYFQEELNREGCQSDDPDNPNPRQYTDMIFYKAPKINKKVNEVFEQFIKVQK